MQPLLLLLQPLAKKVWVFVVPYLAWIILGVVVIAAVAFIRHQWIEQGKTEAKLDAMAVEYAGYKADAENKFKVSAKLESDLAQSRAQAEELNERLKDEIAKNGVYRACRVPAGGVQLLNQALKPPSARSR